MNTPQRIQSGFSLIEVLIALLIFSFGVLALVGLQFTSIRQSSDAKYRSDAALLANRLIGEMWVSDRVAANMQTSFNTGGAGYNAWATQVQAALPVTPSASAPQVAVGADGSVSITIFWKAPSEAPADPMHRYTTVARIQ